MCSIRESGGASNFPSATLVRGSSRLLHALLLALPRDILAHIARIIRLSVLHDVNENGVSFIASECAAVKPILSFHARARNFRNETSRSLSFPSPLSPSTDSRQMPPEIQLPSFDQPGFLRAGFDRCIRRSSRTRRGSSRFLVGPLN